MTIVAKYPGTCRKCGGQIKVGDKINWEKGQGAEHAQCPVEVPDDAIRLGGGSGYGCRGWSEGQVIVNAKRSHGSTRLRKEAEISQRLDAWERDNPCPALNKYMISDRDPSDLWFQRPDETAAEFEARKTAGREEWAKKIAWLQSYREVKQTITSEYPENDGPEYLYVLTASERYIREDGLSFGVGDESGYLYSAVCRPATDDEAAPLRAELGAAAQQADARRELEAIATEIRQSGTRPEGENTPDKEGPRVSDTQDLYGGGDWFVIGTERIWYVHNNGADGDNWALNNVRTGGAGAIGWYVPYSPELATRICQLAQIAERKRFVPH